MAEKIRVILVEDHTLVREGLRLVIESAADMCVIGEAENGKQAVQLEKQLRADVIVLDLVMPALNGAETTALIVKTVPDAKILVLSAYGDDDRIHQLIEAGASGYLVKQSAADELLNAIRQVHAGRAYLAPVICKRVLDKCREALQRRTTLRIAQSPNLTSREIQVLRLVAEGHANKQIADLLGIAIKTVEKHRQELMDRLNLHNTAALTRYAIAHGILDAETVERTISSSTVIDNCPRCPKGCRW